MLDTHPMILDLGVNVSDWLKLMQAYHDTPATLVGAIEHCKQLVGGLRRRWRPNLGNFQLLYP